MDQPAQKKRKIDHQVHKRVVQRNEVAEKREGDEIVAEVGTEQQLFPIFKRRKVQ